MKRNSLKLLPAAAVAVLAVASGAWAQSKTNAEIAVRQGVQASGLASGSAAHSLAASGKATLGVSAVPLRASQGVAASGAATSGASAQASTNAANAPARGPLPVTEQTITVISPDQALKR